MLSEVIVCQQDYAETANWDRQRTHETLGQIHNCFKAIWAISQGTTIDECVKCAGNVLLPVKCLCSLTIVHFCCQFMYLCCSCICKTGFKGIIYNSSIIIEIILVLTVKWTSVLPFDKQLYGQQTSQLRLTSSVKNSVWEKPVDQWQRVTLRHGHLTCSVPGCSLPSSWWQWSSEKTWCRTSRGTPALYEKPAWWCCETWGEDIRHPAWTRWRPTTSLLIIFITFFSESNIVGNNVVSVTEQAWGERCVSTNHTG